MDPSAPRAASRSPRRGASAPGDPAGGACAAAEQSLLQAGVQVNAQPGQLPLADLLFHLKVLDETCVDFLKKVPYALAGEILLSLGPDVRNPSAYITKKLTSVMTAGRSESLLWPSPGADFMAPALEGQPAEVINIHINGAPVQMEWRSGQQVAAELHQCGVLDQGSADFLAKAPNHIAREAVGALGPDVRNPSAFLTKKLKELTAMGGGSVPGMPGVPGVPGAMGMPSLQASLAATLPGLGLGQMSSQDPFVAAASELLSLQAAGLQGAGGLPGAAQGLGLGQNLIQDAQLQGLQGLVGEVVDVYFNGEMRRLEWTSTDSAARELMSWGMLDEISADFLRKTSEERAKQVIRSLGPDVRNPSAYVTKKLREAQLNDIVVQPQLNDSAAAMQALLGGAGCGGCGADVLPTTVCIHHNGQQKVLEWAGKEQAVATLLSWGVLDEVSADFLMKASEHEAREIVGMLGPDVRNPSAFVTMKMKQLQALSLGNLANLGQLNLGALGLAGLGGLGGLAGGLPGVGLQGAGLQGGLGGSGRRDVFTVYHNGAPFQIDWVSKEIIASQLASMGILDQGSADFLMKAPEKEARDIVAALGPDVRNPSAFVTKKLRELQTRQLL